MTEIHYTLAQRTEAAFIGLAVCDALGAPIEFHPRREPGDYVTEMLRNDNFHGVDLPPGHFTDDTSMALCLSASLTEHKDHDTVDQALKYVKWLHEGFMSSKEGPAFDVGIQTNETLRYYQNKPSVQTQDYICSRFDEERRCGNGSLMRVLPCSLIAENEEIAARLARQSSLVTHPHKRCLDACEVYSRLVFHALRGDSKEKLLNTLQTFLADKNVDQNIRDRFQSYTTLQSFKDKFRKDISSSGYVLDSLEAALWSFFRSQTFESGASEVVSLGDDADTVGAIYGGLAGAFYGSIESIPIRWRQVLKRSELIDEQVTKLVGIQESFR